MRNSISKPKWNVPFLLKIIEEDAALVEIGPRFVLNLIKIFQGSFGGPTLYENPHYQSPNMVSTLFLLCSGPAMPRTLWLKWFCQAISVNLETKFVFLPHTVLQITTFFNDKSEGKSIQYVVCFYVETSDTFLFLASAYHKIHHSCKIQRETTSEGCTENEKERTKDCSSTWSHCRCFCYTSWGEADRNTVGKTRAESRFESKKEKDLQKAKKNETEDEQWECKMNQWITNFSVILYLFCIQCVNTFYYPGLLYISLVWHLRQRKIKLKFMASVVCMSF